jgi:hypothetical protein
MDNQATVQALSASSPTASVVQVQLLEMHPESEPNWKFITLCSDRVAMIVPVPTKTHRERRSNYKTSMLQMPKDESGKTSHGLPR